MIRQNHNKSQDSRHSIRRTCNEWRTAADLVTANREIADLRALLADAEAERDTLGVQLDCALHHLDASANYINSAYATAHQLGIVTAIPQCLIAATEFLAQFEGLEKVGRDG